MATRGQNAEDEIYAIYFSVANKCGDKKENCFIVKVGKTKTKPDEPGSRVQKLIKEINSNCEDCELKQKATLLFQIPLSEEHKNDTYTAEREIRYSMGIQLDSKAAIYLCGPKNGKTECVLTTQTFITYLEKEIRLKSAKTSLFRKTAKSFHQFRSEGMTRLHLPECLEERPTEKTKIFHIDDLSQKMSSMNISKKK